MIAHTARYRGVLKFSEDQWKPYAIICMIKRVIWSHQSAFVLSTYCTTPPTSRELCTISVLPTDSGTLSARIFSTGSCDFILLFGYLSKSDAWWWWCAVIYSFKMLAIGYFYVLLWMWLAGYKNQVRLLCHANHMFGLRLSGSSFLHDIEGR